MAKTEKEIIQEVVAMDWHKSAGEMIAAFEMIVGKLTHYVITGSLIACEIFRLYVHQWRFKW